MFLLMTFLVTVPQAHYCVFVRTLQINHTNRTKTSVSDNRNDYGRVSKKKYIPLILLTTRNQKDTTPQGGQKVP